MDPNATLAAMREAVATLASRSPETPLSIDTFMEAVDTLTENVTAMDEWLASGGFLPTDWSTR